MLLFGVEHHLLQVGEKLGCSPMKVLHTTASMAATAATETQLKSTSLRIPMEMKYTVGSQLCSAHGKQSIDI